MSLYKHDKQVTFAGQSSVTLDYGASATSDWIDLDGVENVELGGRALFGATPNGNVQFDFLAGRDNADASQNSEVRASFQLPYQSAAAKQDSRPMEASCRGGKVKVTNLSTSGAGRSVTASAFLTLNRRF